MPGLPPIVFSASSPALMRYLFKCCKVYKFFIFEFLFKISLYQLLKTKIPFFLFMIKIIKKIMNDSLYKNSIYLMMSTGIMSLFGFIFWLVIARLFDTHDVGLATTIISVMSLITGFSVLGLNIALIKYLPHAKDKSKKINTSFTIVAIVSVIVASVYLLGIERFSPDLLFIKENLILALMITNIINPTTTAYYYIAMMIAGLLFAVPAAATQSLFAEGSHNEKELGKQIKKAVKIIALILIPGILITIFFGQYILLAFGKEYSSEGMGLLRILAVSGIFVSANSIFGNILRVRNRIFAFVSVNILRAVVMIGSIYLLVDKGLVGVGYGWLIGSFATTLFYIGVLLVGRR